MKSIVFCIDVEPDARLCTRDDPWNGVPATLKELATLRPQFELATQAPVRFNWFFRFDPQIEHTFGRPDWVTQACPTLIPELQKHGGLAGIHPHFWRWDPRREVWFNDFTDPAWHRHCLQSSIDGYRAVFGAAPVASRCGDTWLGNETVRILREQGIRYDLTIEPGLPSLPVFDDPYSTAWLPDFRAVPLTPYRSSAREFLIPESAAAPGSADPPALWLVPMSITQRRFWMRQRRFPFVVRAPQALNLVMRPEAVWHGISAALLASGPEPLVFVLRSGDLGQPRFLAAFRYVMTRLAAHPGLADCRFTRVDEAVDRFANTLAR